MQAAGLKKLGLAVNSIKDSVMNLGSDDALNIVAFSTTAKAMKQKHASRERQKHKTDIKVSG